MRTAQPEFNYPSTKNDGESSEVNTRYDGRGGFPMSSFGMRMVAAIAEGDGNILLTKSLTPESRMMIRRRVPERLSELAGFITWDTDPYLVITDAGRLVWIVDGYTTSESHPYSRALGMDNGPRFNYIRNSVKATIDAYDGECAHVHFRQRRSADRGVPAFVPGIVYAGVRDAGRSEGAHALARGAVPRAGGNFPDVSHARSGVVLQSRGSMGLGDGHGGAGRAAAAGDSDLYGDDAARRESKPEFLLMLPFTPRNKQNLIGLMVARCDGPHLGELVFLDLPKQEVIAGPLQIEALINQDQTISKDLTLWNQQGSQVLRSQILTLPIDQTFLYVAPIYIQASEARMPQLKKVALVMGNTLVYADTYEQALAQLDADQKGLAVPVAPSSGVQTGTAPAAATMAVRANDPRIEEVRSHLKRYRDFAAQGKWADAGKELEAIEAVVNKNDSGATMELMGHSHEHSHAHSHSHGHPHSHNHSDAGTGRALIASLILTLGFVVFETVAGFGASSLALLSDAGHNFADAFALLLAAFGFYLQSRPAERDQNVRLSARGSSGGIRERGFAGGAGVVSVLRELRAAAQSAAGGGIDHDRGGGNRVGAEFVHRMEAGRPRTRYEHPRGVDPHAGRCAELRGDYRGRGGDSLHRAGRRSIRCCRF